MNQAWLSSMKLHYLKCYYGQPVADIEQIIQALNMLAQTQRNKFPAHAIRNKKDTPDEEGDTASFEEIINRIQSTLKDSKDSMFLDQYFGLVDTDKDGFICHQDVLRMSDELGCQFMSQKTFNLMADRLSKEGTRFSKLQFIDIVREYL